MKNKHIIIMRNNNPKIHTTVKTKTTIMLVLALTATAALSHETAENITTNAVTALLAKVDKTNDQTLLAAYAKHDDIEVRKLAVSKLADMALLKEIIENETDDSVRSRATSTLNRWNYFLELHTEEQVHLAFEVDGFCNTAMILLLVQKLYDITLLTEIAKDNKDEVVRKAAETRLEELSKNADTPTETPK